MVWMFFETTHQKVNKEKCIASYRNIPEFINMVLTVHGYTVYSQNVFLIDYLLVDVSTAPSPAHHGITRWCCVDLWLTVNCEDSLAV